MNSVTPSALARSSFKSPRHQDMRAGTESHRFIRFQLKVMTQRNAREDDVSAQFADPITAISRKQILIEDERHAARLPIPHC